MAGDEGEMGIPVVWSESLFQLFPYGGLLIDPVNLRVISANRGVCDLLGYTEEELKEKTLFDLAPIHALEEGYEDLVTNLLEEGKAVAGEGHYWRKDGKRGRVLGTASLVNIKGKPLLMVFLIDITERWAREQEAERKRDELRLLYTLSGEMERILGLGKGEGGEEVKEKAAGSGGAFFSSIRLVGVYEMGADGISPLGSSTEEAPRWLTPHDMEEDIRRLRSGDILFRDGDGKDENGKRWLLLPVRGPAGKPDWVCILEGLRSEFDGLGPEFPPTARRIFQGMISSWARGG
ncbi:MAG: PAS domain S-box protein [Thermoplasmata archaeon]|nr:PAS domain S-box protein [Thermoplasmata archaeon]